MAKHVLLGITGSIAAYKAAEITSLFVKRGIDVKIILTSNGARFITPLTLETISHQPVAHDMFIRNTPYEVEHIALAKWADVCLIAPASANIIAKYAHGIADDMLSTTLLATRANIVFAPAMNTAMYEHASTANNMHLLHERGTFFIEPAQGRLACGDIGRGRMEDPINIVEYVCGMLEQRKQDFADKTVLVSAGATIEPIDPVRYITNRSTGKMGVAIANAAQARGAKVILIEGNITCTPPQTGVERVRVTSCTSMSEAISARIGECDVFISAAAPADFMPKHYCDCKIKKSNHEGMSLELIPTEDILAKNKDTKGKRIHIGFAAETNNIEENAKLKMASKNLDAIAANDVSGHDCGFACDNNAITLYTRDGASEHSGTMTKTNLAHWLLDRVIGLTR